MIDTAAEPRPTTTPADVTATALVFVVPWSMAMITGSAAVTADLLAPVGPGILTPSASSGEYRVGKHTILNR